MSRRWKGVAITTVLLLLIGGVALGYRFGLHSDETADQVRLKATDAVNPDADPLAEFQRLLPRLASGEIESDGVWSDFLSLATNHAAVRQWMAKTYPGASREHKRTLMACLVITAKDQTYPELVPLLETALDKDDPYAIWACKSLRYYDLPQRREILQRFVGLDHRDRYLVQSSLRVYLDLYGVEGIQNDLDNHLTQAPGNLRGEIAAIILMRCVDPWRAKALDSLNTLFEEGWADGYGIMGVFGDLVDKKVCGDKALMDNAQEFLRGGNPTGRDTVESYVQMCSDNP